MLQGATLAKTRHFALHACDVSAQGASALFTARGVWLGAMAPKRWARRAVTRNAIKRQIYAVGHEFESRLANAAHVVRLRAAIPRAHFRSASSDILKQAVRAELVELFSRALTPSSP